MRLWMMCFSLLLCDDCCLHTIALFSSLLLLSELNWFTPTDNDIGPEGAKAIAHALISNTTLQELGLRGAFVDDVFQFAPPR